jgi:hypothetical protein
MDLLERLEKFPVPGLNVCKFDVKDVQRHKIIAHVLKLYS